MRRILHGAVVATLGARPLAAQDPASFGEDPDTAYAATIWQTMVDAKRGK
jgi:hypothetical protein